MFGKTENHQADLEIFTIYDSKTQSYEVPSLAINHNDLIRELFNMYRRPEQANNKFLVNAEDYSLFRIGTYDKKTGKIKSCDLQHIANLHDLRAQARPDWSIEQYGRMYQQNNTSQKAEMGIVPT